MLKLKCQPLLAAALWCMLSACVSVPAALQTDSQPSLYTGRFAVTYALNHAVQREQGGFEWRIFTGSTQTQTQVQIQPQPQASPLDAPMQLLLTSPLGTTVAVLQFDPTALLTQRASLKTPQDRYFAPTLPALMQHTLGWELPLNALLPWLNAQPPDPVDIDGTPRARADTEWSIDVVSRHETGLPKIITLTHTGRAITARLVFDMAQP